jgi:hypothetical protein
MTPSDKLREIAEKWGWFVKTISLDNHRFELNKNPEQLLSDLTALISEHYTANEEVDKMVEERIILDEEMAEPVQDALYATGRFTIDECNVLTEGILMYIKERGIINLKSREK